METDRTTQPRAAAMDRAVAGPDGGDMRNDGMDVPFCSNW
jgi:hypothetical protein